jgi:adenylylsulfate kinase
MEPDRFLRHPKEGEGHMNLPKSKGRDVVWHPSNITKHDRERLNGHFGATLWFTGLSASGKSTVAHEVEDQLYNRETRSYVLDGDNIRHRLNRDLGFSPEDRKENIRRIGEVAHLFNEVGFIVLCAFISPYRADRQAVRDLQDDGSFFEVFCRCPIEVCELRDPKGLYKKARAGEIADFTGLSAPYEEPQNPELILDTDQETIKESAEKVINFLIEKDIIVRPVVEPPRRIE